MSPLRLLTSALLAAALTTPALAADPEAVATAPAAGAPPTVAQQVDDYLKTSPALALPTEGARGVTSGDEPRKAHGMFDVSVGSGGYRSAYVASEIPIGKAGTATIAVGETRFGSRFGGRIYPYPGQSLGLGLNFAGGLDSSDCRRLRAGDTGSDVRFNPPGEDGRRSSCRSAGAPDAPH